MGEEVSQFYAILIFVVNFSTGYDSSLHLLTRGQLTKKQNLKPTRTEQTDGEMRRIIIDLCEMQKRRPTPTPGVWCHHFLPGPLFFLGGMMSLLVCSHVLFRGMVSGPMFFLGGHGPSRRGYSIPSSQCWHLVVANEVGGTHPTRMHSCCE